MHRLLEPADNKKCLSNEMKKLVNKHSQSKKIESAKTLFDNKEKY